MARKKSKAPAGNTSKPRKSSPSKRARWTGLAGLCGAALLVCANLLVFGPLEIITSNPAEFDVTVGDVLPGLIGLCVGLAALLSLAGLLVPDRHRHRGTAILLALGVLCWIQGSFLKWGYGELDGAGIDWSAYAWQGWVDFAIWVLVLYGAVRFSKRMAPHAAFLALGLLVVQSGVVAVQTSKRPDVASGTVATAQDKAATTLPREICELSENNVFHLLMDGFQSDVFMELVEEEQLSERLDGFTVYSGNMSTGSQTVLSLPALFTAEVYDGSDAQSEYFQRTLSESFHRILFARKFVVNLMPHLTMDIGSSTNYFDTPATYAAPRRTRIVRSSMYLIDISLFRQLPHFWKRAVYNERNWWLSSFHGDPPSHVSFHQKAFLRDYIDALEVKHVEPAYHFMHLMPPHGPFVTASDGSYAGEALPHTYENYKSEARYILRLFMEFLDKLRELGLYDSSIILLHGDHGMGLTPKPTPDAAEKRISKMSALLLLKPPMANGALQVSSAQTALTDIPATVLGLLGIEHAYPGESVVDLDPSTTRTRPVVILGDKAAEEPPLSRWAVTGDVSDPASWQQMETVRLKRRTRAYKWGTPLRFGAAHDGDVYLSSGWSSTSTNYAWNDGPLAKIVFGIERPPTDVVINIELFAYIVPGKVDRQRLLIRVNGISLGETTFTDGEGRGMRTTIPREALQSDRMVVTFEMPDAVAPKDIGAGRESRALAVGLYSFKATLADDR